MFIVFLGFEKGYLHDKKEAAIKIAQNIHSLILEKNIAFTISVGIGRVYEPVNIIKSYKEALNALEYRLTSGGNQVIHIDDVQPVCSKNSTFPYIFQKELKANLRIGDIEGAEHWVTMLLKKISEQSFDQIQIVKSRILELLLAMFREAVKVTGEENLFMENNYLKKWSYKINSEDNIEVLKTWLTQEIMELVNHVDENRKKQQYFLFDKAKDYIKKNYYRDIALEEVANKVFLSPCYFSRLFKQTVGCTFKDYLTDVRLNEAKRLMLQPGLLVQDIAKKVGYTDARYFSHVFKKNEGLSPSKYQKRMLS